MVAASDRTVVGTATSELAAQRYQAALDFNAQQGGKLLDEGQRLRVMSSEGYVPHEDRRSAEALKVNTRTLREAKRGASKNQKKGAR